MRSVMAKVNQSHLLLATVFLVLGTVVHDASTATLHEKDLEAFIQKSSRMIAAPPTAAPTPPPTTTTTAAPTPTTTATPKTTPAPTPTTTAAPTPTTTAAPTPPPTTAPTPPPTTTATPKTTAAPTPPPTTTTAAPTPPPTTTTTAAPTPPSTSALPSEAILEQIRSQLNNITGTLNDLKEHVDKVSTLTTTESTTVKPTPTSTQPTTPTGPTTVKPTPTSTQPTAQPLKARQMIPPLYFLSKIDFGIFRAEQDSICYSETDELCQSLKQVLDDVETISNDVKDEGEATMGELSYVNGNTTELIRVSQSIKANDSFVTGQLNVTTFNTRVDEVTKEVGAAIDYIDDKLSPGDDNTVAIVLGTIFGILGVALIIGAIVMYRKKENKRKQGTNINTERRVDPSSTHSSHSGE